MFQLWATMGMGRRRAGRPAGSDQRAAVSSLSPRSLLDDPALLAPLLGALSAADLSSAASVCRSWQAAERADRNALFHALVRKQWPGLMPPLAEHRAEIDWRHRYRVLSRLGSCRKPPAPELDPLQQYTFTIQGHWGPDGGVAFSQLAVVHKVNMSTVFGGHVMDFKDVVSFEVRAVRSRCFTLWSFTEDMKNKGHCSHAQHTGGGERHVHLCAAERQSPRAHVSPGSLAHLTSHSA
jgi:hypothetical protein